jgi:hypothetical protein
MTANVFTATIVTCTECGHQCICRHGQSVCTTCQRAAEGQTIKDIRYNLSEIPEGRWSGTEDTGFPLPPIIGHSVEITFNGLGFGRVESYFVEHGWVGVCVKLNNPPQWHAIQKKGTTFEGRALVFGREIRPFMV